MCGSCPDLCALPDLAAQCPLLLELHIDGCPRLRALPDLLALASLRLLAVRSCQALRALPLLPAGLVTLACLACPAVRALPPLPAALGTLECDNVAAMCALVPGPALRVLPELYCDCGVTRPDACPADVRFYRYTREYTVRQWPLKVQQRHWTERMCLAPVLPSAAMLYV